MLIKEYVLDGLDCASCAVTIEDKTNLMPQVKKANINFVTQTLKVELEEKNLGDNFFTDIKNVITQIEPRVKIYEKENTKTKTSSIELKLEDLDCADCGNKIEESVNNLENVISASLNFITLKLKVNYKDSNKDKLIDEITSIVNKLEPNVVMHEINIPKASNFEEYLLDNLDCAHCGGQIEEKTKNLSDVLESNLNFVTQTLKVTFKNENVNRTQLFNDIKKIVYELEPNVTLSIKKYNVKENDRDSYKEDKKDYTIQRVIAAGILLALGLLIDFSNEYLKAGVFLISYLIVGYDVIITAIKNALNGNMFDENFLMAIASTGAFLIGEYPEGVAVMIFYQLGDFFQRKAVDKSRKSITDLMDIKPDFANKIINTNNEIEIVSPFDVYKGDTILIKPGEKIPLDGIVIEGTSSVDTVALTGESVPVTVRAGDEILSGSINLNGLLIADVTKEFSESTVSKVLELVENASSKKSTTENFITRFSRYYTPAVVLIAAIVAIIFPIITGDPFSKWVNTALTFLVISCPCALVISIPLGYFGGIGAASSRGILVKGGNYLDILGEVSTVVFDKTGTLTKGVFKVVKLKTYNGFTEKDILKYTAHVENYSTHPIGTSIKAAYDGKINESIISDYEEIPGHGIVAKIDGKEVLAGNEKLLKLKNIDYESVNESDTMVYVSINNKYAGYIVIADEIKEDSKRAIKELHDIGIKNTVILSGDNKDIANRVGNEIGIDNVYAELLPDEKVNILESIMKANPKGGKTAMVGDGINDAPVLTRADVGIAMGGVGSDAAIEAADIVIMTDEPSKISESIRISKITRKVVVQNIVLALGVKAIVLVFGFLGMASMWAAVIADVGVSLIAILNSSRILKIK